MEYRINVPSYRRAEVVKARTLDFLTRNNVDRERVKIWVADEKEYEVYRSTLDASWDIGVSQPGLVHSRCFYHQQYEKGTPLLSIDDDVSDLLVEENKKLVPYRGDFNTFVETGFRLSEENHVRHWGINGAANPMFLKKQITVGLRYIIGAFTGSYAHDPIWDATKRITESSGEDFLSTLMAFSRDGAVLRFDGMSIKTAYFAPGGIDAELKSRGIEERATDHAAQLVNIAKQYPGLAKTYTKAGGVTNIRLKTITAHRLPWHE